MELDQWQKEALKVEGNLCLCTGRQVGKTLVLSRKAGIFMLDHDNAKILVVSLTEDQAELIISMTLQFFEKEAPQMIETGMKKPTKTKILLKNGSQILARPVGNTGDSIRGYTSHILIIDEASRMDEDIFISSRPTLMTTGGKIWIASTLKGKKGFFWECYQNKKNRFTVFHVSSEEVIFNRPISDTWTEDIKRETIQFLQDEKETMPESAYAQEYLAIAQEDTQRFFPQELIEKACVLLLGNTPAGKRYLGCDIARMGQDESSFEGICKVDKDYYVHYLHDVTTKQRLTDTADKIIAYQTSQNFRKIGIDTGGIGSGVYDMLLRSNITKRKIVDLDNSRMSLDPEDESKKTLLKVDMYNVMKTMMEKGQLRLLNDVKVRASLQSIQYEYVKKEGQLTKLRIWGDYSHIVEGLIRAVWCASQDKSLNIWVKWS